MTDTTEFTKYHKIEAATKHPLPPGALVVQHKLDGSQAGIEYQSGALLVHTRKTALARISMDETGKIATQILGGGNAGFAGLVSLVESSFVALRDWMQAHGVVHIYGEWLVPHSVKYPDHMWRKFYVYDLLVEHESGEGEAFMNPESFPFPYGDFGFEKVRAITLVPYHGQVTHEQVRKTTLELQQELGYAIEGTVVKSYEKDLLGETDRFGKRYVYKDVLPDFAETKGTEGAAHAPPPTEQALAESLPTRTIEKRYLDVVAANGGQFEGKLIPQIMGRVWNDFVTEVLDGGLRDLKYPVVNTRELKRLVDQRSRTFALEYVSDEVAA